MSITLLGTKANDKSKGDGERLQRAIVNGLTFVNDVKIVIGLHGVKGDQQSFFSENTLCIDNGTYGDNKHRRLLLNSYRYDTCTIPKVKVPTLHNITLKHNPNGYVLVFLSNSGGFWKKDWTQRLDHIIHTLQNKNVKFKLHPRENTSKKAYIESKGFEIVSRYNSDDLYCAIVQGGGVCYQLAKQGVAMFCLDNIKHMYLCNGVASDDPELNICNNLYDSCVYRDFVAMVDSHTVHINELENPETYACASQI